MAIRMRKNVRVGPLRLNFTQRDFSSWSIKIGPWSWNSRRQRHRVDLPGPWHWSSERRNDRADAP